MNEKISEPAPKRGRKEGADWWAQDNRTERLTEMWKARGMTAESIAAELGTTKNTVVGKINRLGLSRSMSSDNGAIPKADYREMLRALGISPVPLTMMQRLDALMAMAPKHGHCTWPIGHPGKPGFHWCGAKLSEADSLRSYCPEHRAIAEPAPGRRASDQIG